MKRSTRSFFFQLQLIININPGNLVWVGFSYLFTYFDFTPDIPQGFQSFHGALLMDALLYLAEKQIHLLVQSHLNLILGKKTYK